MPTVALLALASAVFYCIAMVAMKTWWSLPGVWIGGLIALSLSLGTLFEIAALREERIGLIYVGILGAEVVILAAVSLFLFGESYTAREILGISIVLIGIAVAWT